MESATARIDAFICHYLLKLSDSMLYGSTHLLSTRFQKIYIYIYILTNSSCDVYC